ncbi:MAG: hypothetical protein AAF224_14015 [Pseudomonadota bacterium]
MDEVLNLSASQPYELGFASSRRSGEGVHSVQSSRAKNGIKGLCQAGGRLVQHAADALSLAVLVIATSTYLLLIAIVGPAVLLVSALFNTIVGPRPALTSARGRWRRYGRLKTSSSPSLQRV